MRIKSFTLKSFILLGIVFVLIVGTLLHFSYDWSHESALVGFIAPVNESVWEHFKLGFYSFILYSLLAYPFVKNKVNNYIFGIGISSFILNLIIVIFYYAYTAFTHKSILWIDISIFILGVLIAFLVLYKLLSLSPLPAIFNWIGLLIILFTISLFIIFTLNPPTRFDLFKDPTKRS